VKTCRVEIKNSRMGSVLITVVVFHDIGRKVSQDPAIKNCVIPHFISTGTLRMMAL